jgi:type 1 glutamine amidotransferase
MLATPNFIPRAMKTPLFPAGLLAGSLLLSAAARAEDGFKPIFNGKDLSGWQGHPELWSVRDGAITGVTRDDPKLTHNTFLVWTNGLLDDFELRLKYRIVGGNSGIQYRSAVQEQGRFGPIVGGYQADLEAGKNFSGILYEERGRGILAQRGQKVRITADPADANKPKIEVTGSLGRSEDLQAQIKAEDWNEYRIVARGNHLQHFINGHQTVDVVDEHPGKAARTGVLALQLHVGPPMTVQFKDIELKRLKLADKKKVVLTAGTPSHGPGEHEHNAGILLLNQCLQSHPGLLTAYYLNGWPRDPTAYDNADAILIYCDGGGGHPFIQDDHLRLIGEKVRQGAGLGCLHYAVEVPKERGGPEFLQWIGGYFETHWSVNPHWFAEFKSLPPHPVTRGVKPFGIQDEWYYHMRFVDGLKGVTPILTALPPASTLSRPDGPHSGNPHVRAAVLERKEPQHVMWVFERPDGGRGFGFTGGHFHKNWGHDDFRKVVLNAIVWMARAEVPENGVESVVTPEQLRANLDPKGR